MANANKININVAQYLVIELEEENARLRVKNAEHYKRIQILEDRLDFLQSVLIAAPPKVGGNVPVSDES